MDERSRVVQGAYEESVAGSAPASNVPGETEGGQTSQLAAGVIRLFDKQEKLVTGITAPGVSQAGLPWYPLHDVVVYDGRVFMRPDEFDDLATNEYAECDALFYTGPM